jgi:hypothetical protein
MRQMGENEMLEVVEADRESRIKLGRATSPFRGGHPAPWLAAGVKSGQYRVCNVLRNGEAVGVFWYWYSPADRCLVVNAGASLVKRDVFNSLFDAIQILARKLGASMMRLETTRRGLCEKLKARGCFAEGVSFTKIL